MFPTIQDCLRHIPCPCQTTQDKLNLSTPSTQRNSGKFAADELDELPKNAAIVSPEKHKEEFIELFPEKKKFTTKAPSLKKPVKLKKFKPTLKSITEDEKFIELFPEKKKFTTKAPSLKKPVKLKKFKPTLKSITEDEKFIDFFPKNLLFSGRPVYITKKGWGEFPASFDLSMYQKTLLIERSERPACHLAHSSFPVPLDE